MSREEQKQRMLDRHAQAVADAVVHIIESGKAILVQGWSGSGPLIRPRNLTTGTVYSGSNSLLLLAEGLRRGQRDMRFATPEAVAKLKDKEGNPARILAGTAPYQIWTPYRPKPVELPADTDFSRYNPDNLEFHEDGSATYRCPVIKFRPRNVVCLADTTVDLPPLPGSNVPAGTIQTPDFKDNEFLEKFTQACGMVREQGGNRACFIPDLDIVRMPEKQTFISEGEYYGTLAHEFFHWTGGKGREERKMGGSFGSKDYAKEEMRAEIFAAMTSVMLGLGSSLEGHAGYVENWSKRVQDDPKAVY